MRYFTAILGIILIIGGISTFVYHGYSYQSQEKIAEIGSVQLTQEQTKTVRVHPALGGTAIVAGLILVVLAGRRKK